MIKPFIYSLFLVLGLSACEAKTPDFVFLSDEEFVDSFKVCEIDTDCMMVRTFCFLPESINKTQEYAYFQYGKSYIEENYRRKKKGFSPACKTSEYVDITALRPVCKMQVCNYEE